MTSLELVFDNKDLRQAFARSPQILRKHLDNAILRAVGEMARKAQSLVPKANSTLWTAIKPRQPEPLTGEVVAGTDYARLVEEGTGPGGRPPVQTMLDWIKVHGITPNDPTMDQTDLAFVMARSIAQRGTPAQPFMKPAFEDKKARAQQLIDQALDRALAEMGA